MSPMNGPEPASRALYRFFAVAMATLIAIAGFAAGLDAGGTIENVPPRFSAFTCEVSTTENSGRHTQFISGDIRDSNGEEDFAGGEFVIAITGPEAATLDYTVKQSETARGAEPAQWSGSGWKVWSGEGSEDGDGTIHVKARWQVRRGLPAGEYTVTPSYTPQGGETIVGPACRFTVSTFNDVDAASEPVGPDGNLLGTNWGMWLAAPGHQNISSTNYIRLRNTGGNPTLSVHVDFTDAFLRGKNDTRHTIPLDGNIQFAMCEVENATIPPSECSFAWGTTSPTSTITANFTGLDKAIYLAYRVVQIPGVLKAQAYGAQYTVNVLPP